MRKLNSIWLALLLVSMFACKSVQPTAYESNTTEINKEYNSDESVEDIIAPYKVALDEQMNRVIGVFATDMKKAKPESELANFMCDATQNYYNSVYGVQDPADLTVMNYGGIRLQHIPKGDVTVNTMFELMPFENEIVAIEIPGNVLMQFFERMARSNGWPVSDNVRMVIKNQKIISVELNGKPVKDSETYTLLTSDYIAHGGDGIEFLKDLPTKRVGEKLRDILIAYVEMQTEEGKQIKAPITGRVVEQN